MKTRAARGIVLALALVLLAGREASAFYPLGGFNASGNLILARWPLVQLDTNNDGDVTANEGIPLTFESGATGFDEGEIARLMEGFDVWDSVTTSYAAFRFLQKTSEPLELEQGLDAGAIDFLNYVAFVFEDDDGSDALGDAVGVALVTFAMENTQIVVDNISYPVTGGQIIDVDMVIDALTLNNVPDDDVLGLLSLKGTAVYLGGLALGLQESPMYNFSDVIRDDDGNIILASEERVVALPDVTGQPVMVGVTPSMLGAVAFSHTDQTQAREDLAPDDIAGISFIYPRSNQVNFMSVDQEARTQTRPNFPSGKLEGAHIVAWCDADNNASTDRVPFVDTLTGLYQAASASRGFFSLKGLFKQLPDKDGVLFEPTYTFSCAPFTLEINREQSSFDTTHNGSTDTPISFASNFPAEVFHEGGNRTGLDNIEVGTAMVFSPLRNQLVSVATGRTLNQILPNGLPMFGDRNNVCPLLVTVASLEGVTKLPTAMRGLRDSVLFETAVGTAVADLYYQMGPGLAQYLLDHPMALGLSQILALSAEWCLGNAYLFPLLLLLPVAMVLRRCRTRRLAAASAASLMLAAMALYSVPAHAQANPKSTEELVQKADEIVVGQVVSVESRWTEKNQIVTDVIVAVDDTVKGRVAKSSSVEFTIPGGRVGDIVTVVSSMPSFAVGDEAVFFLKNKAEKGYTLSVNAQAKREIKTDPDTGEKYVAKTVAPAPPQPLFNKNAPKGSPFRKNADKQEPKENRVALEDLKAQLRQIVEQQKNASTAK